MILENIHTPADVKALDREQLEPLCRELRQFLVEHVSKTGGHLASNLGVVELTMALHLAFDLPKDKIIWDVGHQAYTHKILSGRKDGFDDLRAVVADREPLADHDARGVEVFGDGDRIGVHDLADENFVADGDDGCLHGWSYFCPEPG